MLKFRFVGNAISNKARKNMVDPTTGEEVKDPSEAEIEEGATTPPTGDGEGGEEGSPEGEGAGDGDGTGEGAPAVVEDDGTEPPTRKTPKDFIIERKQRQLEKARGGRAADDEGDDDTPVDEGADAEFVDKRIQESLEPILSKQDEKDRDNELNEFVQTNPKFAPYKAKIARWWAHQSRVNLPVRTIAFEVAGDDLMRLGAQRGAEADAKARKGNAGGHSVRGAGGKKSVLDMTDKEFVQYQQEVMMGNSQE